MLSFPKIEIEDQVHRDDPNPKRTEKHKDGLCRKEGNANAIHTQQAVKIIGKKTGHGRRNPLLPHIKSKRQVVSVGRKILSATVNRIPGTVTGDQPGTVVRLRVDSAFLFCRTFALSRTFVFRRTFALGRTFVFSRTFALGRTFVFRRIFGDAVGNFRLVNAEGKRIRMNPHIPFLPVKTDCSADLIPLPGATFDLTDFQLPGIRLHALASFHEPHATGGKTKQLPCEKQCK